jgi:hypothetical protein
MSVDRKFGYGSQPTTTQSSSGLESPGAQNFYTALNQASLADRAFTPIASAPATQQSLAQLQTQTQAASTPATPAPDPTNEDPAYQLLNRGGSLKLQQLADYNKNNPDKNAAATPLNTAGSGYGLATAPALTVSPGFNGGFVPVSPNGQPIGTNGNVTANNGPYGYIVPVGTIDANGRPIDGTGNPNFGKNGYGMFVPVGTVQDGQLIPGFGNGITYNGFGSPTFDVLPAGYGSANPVLLTGNGSGTLLPRVY